MTKATLLGPLAAIPLSVLMSAAAANADSACMSDAVRFCSQIPIGEGRVMTCLQARWSELSSGCQQEIQRIQNRAREFDLACSADVWQYCSNVVPGADRIRVCLWSRWDDLSSTCRDKAAELADKTQKLQQLCADDMTRLCPGLRPGGGQIYMCLKAQESKTSGQCRSALR